MVSNPQTTSGSALPTLTFVVQPCLQLAKQHEMTVMWETSKPTSQTSVEYGETEQLFTNPKDERTQGYITGRFG